MLVLQIAAGIVLAAILLRFWRQSVWVAAVLVGLALVAGLVLWAGHGAYMESLIVVAVAVFAGAAIRGVRRRNHPVP